MTPSQADIAAALHILDWLYAGQIAKMRAAVSSMIRAAIAAAVTHGGPGLGGETARPWDPIERTLVYVLWISSDEYLEQRVREAPPAVH